MMFPYDSMNHLHEDSASLTYIPRATRAAPQAHTVHTIYVKKVSHPLFSTRPDELWILELNSDGLETWRPIESFLGTWNILNIRMSVLANLFLRFRITLRSFRHAGVVLLIDILKVPQHPYSGRQRATHPQHHLRDQPYGIRQLPRQFRLLPPHLSLCLLLPW